jgi:hypothetical protein
LAAGTSSVIAAPKAPTRDADPRPWEKDAGKCQKTFAGATLLMRCGNPLFLSG